MTQPTTQRPRSGVGPRKPPARPTVSRTSARRFARRQWRRRLRRARPTLLAAGLLLAAGFGVWAVWFSTLLDVRSVDVRGLPEKSPLTADDIRSAAGIEPGSPLVRVDLDAVRSDVLDELPALKDATAHRAWPHEVVVEVTERTPVAVVQARAGGKLRLVDANGFPFRTVARRPVDRLLIEAESGHPLDEATRKSAVRVGLALPEELRNSVASVSAGSPDSVRLHLLAGAEVMWGSAERSDVKATVLRALRKQRSPDEVEVYDVSVPSYPTVQAR